MAQASRDENFVPTLLGASTVDGVTPVKVYANPVTHRLLVDSAGGGSGTVQTVAVATANGFAGTSDGDPANPTLTLTTTINSPVLKGNGTAISAATTTGSGSTVMLNNAPTIINTLTVGAASGATGAIAFKGTTSGTVTLTTADAAGTWTMKLPITGGTNLYFLQTDGNGVTTWAAGGSGDVVGPASATDNAVARFDGTTGKLIQNSAVTIADTSGDITGGKYNGLTITTSTGVLTIVNGKTLTVSNTLTFTGTDSSSVAFGTGGTVLYTSSTIPITVGSTTIASGTNTRILYDNSGMLGEYTLTGSGTVVAMQTAPTFVTSIQSPKVIGGSGTTGTQLIIQTTTGNGTTDVITFAGGNNGGTTFATLGATSFNTGTSSVFTAGTIELGAASDTTIARVSAGVISVEGVTVDTISAANTLTNKTLTSPIINTAPVFGDAANIKYTIPTVDGTATGDITNQFNSGYSSTAIGDLVYLDASATWQKADADASATTYSSLLGIALSVTASASPATVLLRGFIYAATPFPTFTIGLPVYMSATAGAVTQTAPVTTDSATRLIGYAIHADKMWFCPSNDWITHT